jgi:hypothetical protein
METFLDPLREWKELRIAVQQLSYGIKAGNVFAWYWDGRPRLAAALGTRIFNNSLPPSLRFDKYQA